MATAKSPKDVVRQYVDAFNRCDIDTLRTLFDPDAVIYGVLGSGGLDEAIPLWRELHAAFGVVLTVEEIIAKGEQIAVRYTERGRFVQPFRGTEPTGKMYELVAMEWFVLRQNRIHLRWGARDPASQARQIGL
jgi:hypothetical protein